MKFLIVEDDFTSRRLLLQYLAEFGECAVAVNGQEAITAVEESFRQGEPYDLICLDILMPDINGNECLKRFHELREQYSTDGSKRLNVVMTTSLADDASIDESYSAGCEYYLIKPVERRKLMIVMSELGLIESASVMKVSNS